MFLYLEGVNCDVCTLKGVGGMRSLKGKRTESHRTKSHKTPRTESHRTKSHNLYFCLTCMWVGQKVTIYIYLDSCIVLVRDSSVV